MNLDEFEQHLKAQPFQSIPRDWREELLRGARRAAAAPAGAAPTSALRRWLGEWLWPAPLAWGALAACWVAVLVLNRAALPSAAELAETRANARLALAYQALVREFGTAESGEDNRSTLPTGRPLPRRSDRSQARPNPSAAFAPHDRTKISTTQEMA